MKILSRIDQLIEHIIKVSEQKQLCMRLRLFQTILYQLFVDLVRIYQSYYMIITYLLSLFDQMSANNAKRTFIIYNNFIRINKEIRNVATWVMSELKFNL
jgi:nitrate/nitrite-specific signal transduction histidine kinase